MSEMVVAFIWINLRLIGKASSGDQCLFFYSNLVCKTTGRKVDKPVEQFFTIS